VPLPFSVKVANLSTAKQFRVITFDVRVNRTNIKIRILSRESRKLFIIFCIKIPRKA